MNYEQLTAFYRVEQRSRAYAMAALANLAITVALSLWLVVGLNYGPTGALAGNVSGTLAVWLWLVIRRRRDSRRRSTATSCAGCSTSACRSCPPRS